MLNSFNFWFAGAEQPLSAEILAEEKVTHQMVSFFEWEKRHDLKQPIGKYFDTDVRIGLTPGVSKRHDIDWERFCRKYVRFAQINQDDLELVLEIDNPNCPTAQRLELRHQLFDFKDKLVVFPTDEGQVHFLGQHQIGLNATTAQLFQPGIIKGPIHLVNTTSKRRITRLHAASASTLAWLSPRRYGEAWVFEHGKLVHFQAPEVDEALADRVALLEGFRVDPEARDPETLTRLAVRALQAFAADVARISARKAPAGHVVTSSGHPATPTESHGSIQVAETRESVPVLRPRSESDQEGFTVSAPLLRACESCYLSARCPRFELESTCSYEIPVTIRTKDDWKRVTPLLIEMQFQRVAFGYFAEQVEGGAPQERTGREMDRFFKMLREQKELEQEGPPPPAEGLLSQIFGATQMDIAALPETTGQD